MFYLGVFLVIACVFGVLNLAIDGTTPALFGKLSYHWSIDILLFLTLVGLCFWLYRLSVREYRLGRKILIQLGAIAFIAVIFMIKALLFFEYHKPIVVNSVVVRASVQVDELSDSLYDVATNSTYRQKAYLSDIQLVKDQTKATAKNPFNLPNLNNDTHLPSKMTVLLTAYPNQISKKSAKNSLITLNDLTAGKSATMTLKLTNLPKTDNAGFDTYRYLLSRHIHANAQVLEIDNIKQTHGGFLVSIQKLREHYRQVFLRQAPSQANAVTLSLLTGDRALIDKDTKASYQYAGISHLLAISGTHVLFLAMMLSALIIKVVNRFVPNVYRYVARWQLSSTVMIAAAFIYALFVGADFPAMRTVYFLLTAVLARQLLISFDVIKLLLVVALIMLYIEPFALWQASFWLSFVASALLMAYGVFDNSRVSVWQSVKLQGYLFVAMLPIGVVFFGKVSLVGLFVNLFAVGLFGFVIVPSGLLAGVLYGVLPNVSLWIWSVLGGILTLLHHLIEVLQVSVGNSWISFKASILVVVLGFLIIGLKKLSWVDNRFLVLPSALLVLAILGAKHSEQALVIKRLPNSQNINQTLVYDNKNTWLIMSFHKPEYMLDYQKAFDELYIVLKQHNIDKLSGIIIQNNAQNLGKMAGLVSLSMPVYELWYAGVPQRFGKINAQQCIMDKTWASDGFEIQAMTGFKIDNRDMNTCQLIIKSHIQSKIIQTDKEPLMFDKAVVMINTKSNQKLWQVWQLLCLDDKPLVDVVLDDDKDNALPFAIKTRIVF